MKEKYPRKSYKFYAVQRMIKDEGICYAFTEKIIPYLTRPITDMIKRSELLLNIFYGFFPTILQKLFFSKRSPKIFKTKKNKLVEDARAFWYSNRRGDFILEGERISRNDIFLHGGPNLSFDCFICQKSEWLSRVRQKNLYVPHVCSTAEACKALCAKQGDDLWTHFHQNFDFSLGCEPGLPAPKGIYVLLGKINMFFSLRLEPLERIFRRQFAYSCQMDVAEWPRNINWREYDFAFFYHSGCTKKFKRPDIPVVLFCHDFWPMENKGYQWVIDWLEPDILLTTYPTQWQRYFKLPFRTKVVFTPMFPSRFFTRPNLTDKRLDLLVIGNTNGHIYAPRKTLSKQISQLNNRHKVEFSHIIGALPPDKELGLCQKNPLGGPSVNYLNKWSEYLGSAKYVTFGRMRYSILLGKYYEALGSGAIPIFPDVPDLKLLGLKPFEHYIPLSEIEGNNKRLSYFLDNYEKFRYIAGNAVRWYNEVSDKMLFNGFENVIRGVTRHKFPKRLI